MFTLELWAAGELARALGSAWRTFADCTTPGQRDRAPMCIVQLQPGSVQAQGVGAVQLAPILAVQLVARRSNATAAMLGDAIAAAIGALHGAAPGKQDRRFWERLALQGITHPIFEDEGLVCAELLFQTSAKYMGCKDSQ